MNLLIDRFDGQFSVWLITILKRQTLLAFLSYQFDAWFSFFFSSVHWTMKLKLVKCVLKYSSLYQCYGPVVRWKDNRQYLRMFWGCALPRWPYQQDNNAWYWLVWGRRSDVGCPSLTIRSFVTNKKRKLLKTVLNCKLNWALLTQWKFCLDNVSITFACWS